MIRRMTSITRGRWSVIAVGMVLVLFASASAAGVWVFRSAEPAGDSVWRLVFSDRATMGFVRGAVVMLALYAIASVAALIATGRWIRSLKTTGIDVDDSRSADATIEGLRVQLRDTEQERDEARRLLWRSLGG